MKVYLDNCCFNRPFDDQTQVRIRLEAEAKLDIQSRIEDGRLSLVWSYMLDFENLSNPFDERRETIQKWRDCCTQDMEETTALLNEAQDLEGRGVRPKDALHVACAVSAECEYFVTTDDLLLAKLSDYDRIAVVSPPELIRRLDA